MNRQALPAALALLLAACAWQSPVDAVRPELPGDRTHPAQTEWRRSELYFSLGPVDDPARQISPARWQRFLDQEVTPRFPDGLTVLDAYGQWRDQGARQVERLATRVLLILHPDGATSRQKIDAIRVAWKKLSGDRSVLEVTQPAQISF